MKHLFPAFIYQYYSPGVGGYIARLSRKNLPGIFRINLVRRSGFTTEQDTTGFTVDQFELTKAYSFSKQCDCACEWDGRIQTNEDDILNISMQYSVLSSDTTFYFTITYDGHTSEKKSIPYAARTGSYSDSFSETNYPDVFVFDFPDPRGPVSKAIIANGYGIIRLFEKTMGLSGVWLKTKRSLEKIFRTLK
jgi:hypothetical protein